MRRHQQAQKAQNSQSNRSGERPTLKKNASSGNSQQKTPSKKGHIHQQDLEYFTNHHFSRSFNSLILEDPEEQSKSKKLNKSPPFNVKSGQSIDDTIDDTIDDNDVDASVDFFDYDGSDLDFSSDNDLDATNESDSCRRGNELQLSQAKKSAHFDFQDKERPAESSSPSKSVPRSGKPLLKRSSKYFNLSIDSPFVPGFSSPHSTKESKITSSPLAEKGTPFNKFKRPHKLVSQSPSPCSGNKFKLSVAAASPSKSEKASKMFKNSTKIRIKSPLKPPTSLSTSSPTATEFSLPRFGKSPNSRFMSSSSPLAGHVFDDHAFQGYDESPSRQRRRGSSNFNIYQDQEERRPSATSKPLGNAQPPSSSGTSFSEANKENEHAETAKSGKKTSFRSVKPLQIAFESVGLRKKSSLSKTPKKAPPETPMKRPPPIIYTNDANRSLDNESFLDQDHSIEVGRNYEGAYLHSNDSNTSFFKLPMSAKSDHAMRYDALEPSDMDPGSIPETPTKSTSRGKKLNVLVEDPLNKAPLRFPEMSEAEPCTPISQFPMDSIVSSQATLSVPTGNRAFTSSEQTITVDHAEMIHAHDPLSAEPQYLAPKSRLDERLVEKFGRSNIKYIGSGNFSVAFECNFQGQKFAIKRNRKRVSSSHEKKALMREIDALRALTSFHEGETEVAEGKENLVYFVEAWTAEHYFYIMTEFCEGGTLSEFMRDKRSRNLDEFRKWKILIEIMSGLKYIHSKNYLHLDLKPANIFITFDGSLKIGDFGLSAKLPILEEDFDLEGDRHYIAPELINDKIYTPYADIFCVGTMMLEIAADVDLPPYGKEWTKLRSGDLSDAGRLSNDNISDFMAHNNFSSITSYNSSLQSVNYHGVDRALSNATRSNISASRSVPEQSTTSYVKKTHDKAAPAMMTDIIRELIPKGAPEFLLDNSNRLDKLVKHMMKPNPFDRPTASDILGRRECVEIEARRKAGATIFEGEFGPNDDD